MEVKILQANDIAESIRSFLSWASNANIAVAYASYDAFLVLKEDFENFLRNNKKIRVIFDIERFITDKNVIEEFATIPGDSECKVFLKNSKSLPEDLKGYFHPKFYLFYNNERYNVIIGSSNFTLNGIKSNLECNISISGYTNDDFFPKLTEYFSSLWHHKYALNILNYGELIEAYGNLLIENKKEEEKKNQNLSKIIKSIEEKQNLLIQSRNEILNENFAYLLGLICANSSFDKSKRVLKIFLTRGLSNKGKEYEGFYYTPEISDYKISQFEAHKMDMEKIKENLMELIKYFGTKDSVEIKHIKDFQFELQIIFDENSPIFSKTKEIILPFLKRKGKILPFIPKEIKESNDRKIVLSFLRGYCDLKSRISASDGIYTTDENGFRKFTTLRIGISISHNSPELVDEFKKLFEKIGLTEGISFSDTETRDREYLIRINVKNVPYELLGTHWRRIFLKDFLKYINDKEKTSEKDMQPSLF